MDRRIMLLLASLMLVFSLAACGSDRTAGDMDQNGTVSGGSAAGAPCNAHRRPRRCRAGSSPGPAAG